MVRLPDNDIEPFDPDDEVSSWVFVSHTVKDADFIIKQVVPSHLKTGFHLLNWKSRPEIVANAYKRNILQTLSRCGWFMVVVSQAAIISEWVRFEVCWAIEHKSKERIVIVLLEQCDYTVLHPGLASMEAIEFYKRPKQARKEIEELVRNL